MAQKTPSSESGDELSRDLSLFDITMIGVGAMIGAGIFVLTGEAAGVAGPSLTLSFALNGVVTIFTAMVYAELGSAIPEAGGGYLWIKEGLPGANAFLAGWMSWFAHAVAGALYCLGFGAFVYEILNILGVHLAQIGLGFSLGQKLFGVLIGIAFAYINFRGASETGLAGNIVTLTKMTIVLAFCLFGVKFMFYPDLWFSFGAGGGAAGIGLEQLQPFIPDQTGWAGVFSAMGLTFIAFEGYEIIVQAGEEVVEPRKNIPKAVFWSLAIVVPTYMLVAFVLVGGTDTAYLIEALREMGRSIPEGITAASQNWQVLRHIGELGLAQAASQFVPYGALLILVGGMVSTMSALNATTFSSTRVSFAMGRDRNLPDMFAEVHPRTRTPYFAVMWSAALICFMVAFVPITTVAAAADIMFLLLFLQVNVAVITLRKKYGDMLAYGYLMPFYPVVPIIGIVTKLGLALFMFDHYPVAWVYVLIWLGVGFVLYRFYAYGREREKEAPPVAYEERALTPKEHSVLIPVADPEAARQFIHLGARIAKARDSELVLLHAEQIPRQLPASAAGNYIQESRPVLDEARAYAERFDVPVSTISRLARDVSDAIVYTAEDKNTDYLIMGWRGDVHGEETQIGDNIDHVLKDANTHSIVMQRGDMGERERILVPVANPETAPLSIAVGGLLYKEGGPEVKLLHVPPEPMSDADREAFRDRLLAFIEDEETDPQGLISDPSRFDFEVKEAQNPAEEIVRRSGNYDRIVLGTSRGRYLGRKVFGRFPLQIAEQARCPVVFTRLREPGFKYGIQQFFQFFQELETSGSPEEIESA